MKKPLSLPKRPEAFVFNHRPSQVNYGGTAHFHQAAFPPQEQGQLETITHQALQHYLDLFQTRPGLDMSPQSLQSLARTVFAEDAEGIPGVKEWQTEITDVYFDQLLEVPHFNPTAFKEWLLKDLVSLAKSYTRIRSNAVIQEHTARVEWLNYVVALASVNLIAAVTSDYFKHQIALHHRLALTARLNWGRAVAWALRTAELGNPLQRLRAEHLGHPQPDPVILQLINPHNLVYAEAEDAIHVEEILLRINPYRISAGLRTGLTEMLLQIISANRHFIGDDIKKSLAEPETLVTVLASRFGRRQLVRHLRSHRGLRQQLVTENAQQRIRQALRAYVCEHPVAEAVAQLMQDRSPTELLSKPPLRKKFLKALKKQKQPWREWSESLMREFRGVKASRRRWLGRLRGAELLREAEEGLQRLLRFLAEAEDFRALRAQYALDPRHGEVWQGLKLFRAWSLSVNEQGKNDQERLTLTLVWGQRAAELENSFAEGNLFLCVAEGEVYPVHEQKRGQVIFMFADLRNSTETTMKLTKDTASYLAPYLTTVNAAARHCQGTRIYFAGDGFAAYFPNITDALRAGFTIAARFQLLQEQSGEQLRQKSREIYQRAAALELPLQKPRRLTQALAGLEKARLDPELREFLVGLSQAPVEELTEAMLRNTLIKTASAYTMPRVEIGLALTAGELFFAMVGEGDEEKIPIVISPQLTQAARLSGSSDVVKNYLETHFPQPFRYNVFAWDKKLYNRGIVVTEQVFSRLKQEVKVNPLDAGNEALEADCLFGYYDAELKHRLVLRKNQEPVLLKGIAEPCPVYEVALPGSALDRQFGGMI